MEEATVTKCQACECDYLTAEIVRRFFPPVTAGQKGTWRNVCDMCVKVSRINLWSGVLNDNQRETLAKAGGHASYIGNIEERWTHDGGTIQFFYDDTVRSPEGIPAKLLPVLAKVAKMGLWSRTHEERREAVAKLREGVK